MIRNCVSTVALLFLFLIPCLASVLTQSRDGTVSHFSKLIKPYGVGNRFWLHPFPFQKDEAANSTGQEAPPGNFELCTRKNRCRRGKRCTPLNGLDRNRCARGDFCLCFPKKLQSCNSKSQCGEDEVCADTVFALQSICVAKGAEERFPFMKEVTKPLPRPLNGLTLDPCDSSDTCAGDRSCLHYDGERFENCQERENCYCMPQKKQLCFQEKDCPTGETCSNAIVSNTSMCASEAITETLLSIPKIKVEPSQGYTLESCRDNEDCQGSRVCTLFEDGGSSRGECRGGPPCACMPRKLPVCEKTTDCVSKKELCANSPFSRNPTCISYEAAVGYGGIDRVFAEDVCPVVIKQDSPLKELPNSTVRERGISLASRGSLEASERIVGGLFASPKLGRYIAAVYNSSRTTLCTGAMISPRWVLTAAHCDVQAGSYVELGATQAHEKGNGKFFKVSRAFNHPNYRNDEYTYDIALAELEEGPLDDTLFMKVNEDMAVPAPGSYARVVGFGLNSYKNRLEDKDMYALRQVDVPVIPHEKCAKAYNETSMTTIVKSHHVCAGEPRGGCGSCFGDSGGPLFQYTEDVPTVMGVTSFGIECATPKYSGIYARVANYIPWMISTGAVFYTNRQTYNQKLPCQPGEVEYKHDGVTFCRVCARDEISVEGKCKRCSKGLRRNDNMCSCMGKLAAGRGLNGQVCRPCEPGWYSSEKDSVCKKCKPGTYSKSGASECAFCETGKTKGGTSCLSR